MIRQLISLSIDHHCPSQHSKTIYLILLQFARQIHQLIASMKIRTTFIHVQPLTILLNIWGVVKEHTEVPYPFSNYLKTLLCKQFTPIDLSSLGDSLTCL